MPCSQINTDAVAAEVAEDLQHHAPSPSRQTASGPISLELFGLEDCEDEPLTFPVQASITVLPVAGSPYTLTLTDTNAQQADSISGDGATLAALSDANFAVQEESAPSAVLVAAVQQNTSGPISLELFGMEDQPDNPIELAVPAFRMLPALPDGQAVLLDDDAKARLAALGFEPSMRDLPAAMTHDFQHVDPTADYWLVMTKLMQVLIGVSKSLLVLHGVHSSQCRYTSACCKGQMRSLQGMPLPYHLTA